MGKGYRNRVDRSKYYEQVVGPFSPADLLQEAVYIIDDTGQVWINMRNGNFVHQHNLNKATLDEIYGHVVKAGNADERVIASRHRKAVLRRVTYLPKKKRV